MAAADTAFSDDGLVDYNVEEAIKTFFQSDACDSNHVAADYVIARGKLENPYAKDLLQDANLSSGVQYCKWNGDVRDRSEGHFALNTIIPLPDGCASDKFVLISIAELESLRRKVELHVNVDGYTRFFSRQLTTKTPCMSNWELRARGSWWPLPLG